MFTRAIAAPAWQAPVPCHRRHANNSSLTGNNTFKCEFGAAYSPPKINIHHFSQCCKVRFLYQRPHRNACIIDQDIYTAEFCNGGRNKCFALSFLANVSWVGIQLRSWKLKQKVL